MNLRIREAAIGEVAELARISIAFRVERICTVDTSLHLAERPVTKPYLKDYDAVAGEGPRRWARMLDVAPWGFLRAECDARLVGGAVIARRTPAIALLGNRADVAAVWDLRVAPAVRGMGIGSALLAAADRWAAAHGCAELRVETQNINVAACRLYARHGFVLRTAEHEAYPDLPGEIRLLWFKRL